MNSTRIEMLDTRSEETICKSLANILGIAETAIEVFFIRKMGDYVCKQYWEIDTDIFYDYFRLNKEEFILDEIVFYHVTTRLTKQKLGEFQIDNLDTVLLSDNPITRLCQKHDILFKREDGISVYYQGKRKVFDKPMEGRLRNRLDGINDSCVNGFLFNEKMDDSYIGLTGMPEIFSDIMVSIERRDIQQEYFEKKICYLATVVTKLQKVIFDGSNLNMTCLEKTQKIIQYLLCYVAYKKTLSDSYMSNPMVRLADNYCVPAYEIVEIREIHNWKEIFEY